MDDIIKFFSRHMVSVSCKTNGPGDGGLALSENRRLFALTGFAAAVGELWFLVTAGHIARQLRETLNNGHELTDMKLLDDFGTSPVSHLPVPFAFDPNAMFEIDSESGWDFSVICLRPNTIALLKQNGITPVQLLEKQPLLSEMDYFFVLGIPSENTSLTRDKQYMRIKPALITLRLNSSPPLGVEKQDPLLYFDVPNEVRNMMGMSGGPIIAVRKLDSGWRYWVVGIQNGWDPEEHITWATPLILLQQVLLSNLAGVQQGQLSAS